MRIFVTGATGFIGRAVVARLQRDGHSVIAWTRDSKRAHKVLGDGIDIVDAAGGSAALSSSLPASDAVVNLAGEPIVGRRWTAARRRQLVDSRVGVTEALVASMEASSSRPRVLVSASAVGYYGDRAGEMLAEDSTRGEGFLADLCARWEAAARRAEALGTRVVLPRIGVVLGAGGGALARMLPPFRLGLGGPLGSGRQYMAWIHRHDLASIVAAALGDDSYRGPLNGVAPQTVTNGEFSRALGRALRRPAILPLPATALRMIFGEAATVLLDSQRVMPQVLAARGFQWRFPAIDGALDEIVRGQ
jgi:uncharacterized protein (TIGR01777 family)